MFEIFGLNFVINDLDVWFNSLLFLYLVLIATVANKDTLQIYMYPDGKGVLVGALAKLWYSFLNSINDAKVFVDIWLEKWCISWYQSVFLRNLLRRYYLLTGESKCH